MKPTLYDEMKRKRPIRMWWEGRKLAVSEWWIGRHRVDDDIIAQNPDFQREKAEAVRTGLAA